MQAPANAQLSAASVPAPGADEPNPLHQVKATLTVCVGSVVLTVGELLKARKEQVIRLDSGINDSVDLLIEGKVVARGQLVAIDDHFAVRITQLPQALKV
jgi:flagellar motor switch protein FliN/FliY